MRKFVVLASAVLVFVALAMPQTKKSKSAVGVWQLDLERSDFGAEPAPKQVTLTILQDTRQMLSWRIHSVDDNGNAYTFSWSGPTDGSVHPIEAQDSTSIGTESVKRQPDGSLVRHGETSGASFDAHSTMSTDGNTMLDEITQKSKDGKENKSKRVYRRAPAR